MRIVSGRLGGRRLIVPSGTARPTTDRVREALFSSLQSRIDFSGRTVLDLFAGSGALGLEALSRGAEQISFVDQSTRAVSAIRRNVEILSAEDCCQIYRDDAVRFLKRLRGDSFDLVFADPPYGYATVESLPDLILPIVNKGGMLILEHDHRRDFSAHSGLVQTRSYGGTVLSYFAPPEH
jgi:16S rRNA (guanine(966)-N(2))-methyltransferase RsmD